MGAGTLNCKTAEVNGTKKNRCVTGVQNGLQTAKEPSKETFLTRLLKSFMGVFGNDFAAVDVREELCYHSRPKKQIREGWESQKLLSRESNPGLRRERAPS